MRLPRAVLAAALACALLAQACQMPRLEEEQERARELPQTSFLFAGDCLSRGGRCTLITELHGEENRVVVPLSRIPERMRNAVIAVEDKRFYQHRGIDLKALLRAAYVDATAGRIVEGGSTITQQYVKNVFVGSERSLDRKVREALLAWQLEQRLTKDQILARYLNTVYFGRGAYGIQAAADTFFSVDVEDLTLARSALLAGLIRNPADYDPFQHPHRAVARRNHVLDVMLELGMITPQRHRRATEAALALHPSSRGEERYAAPYFVDHVIQWFLTQPGLERQDERFGPPCPPEEPYRSGCPERWDMLFQGGLRIYSTVSPRLQSLAEQAVSSVLPYPSDPRAALVAIDPRTGWVRAMVGGRDYWDPRDRFARLNLATGGSTGRQAGSSFKTFALVAALEHGIAPERSFPGSSTSVVLDTGQVWTPENYEGAAYGSVSMRTATVNSVNVAYVEIEKALGDGDPYAGARLVVEAAQRMGIRCCERTAEPDFPLQPVPSAVLGTNEINPLEMAVGYGTLATGGYRVMPTPVARITDARGNVLWSHEPKPKLVVDPAVATVAVDILEDVVRFGTGTAANIGRPQFGKTGTAQNWSDAWFIGAIPQLVASVWVGYPESQRSMAATRIGRVTGGSWPAAIWHAFMARAAARIPERDFPRAEVRYVTVRVDITQGCLANPYTPPGNIRTVSYIAGTEPRKVCKEPSEYQYLTVPSVVGLSQEEASRVLRGAGFAVRVETARSDQPPGTVIGQDPSGGERALQTSTVTITVAEAPRMVVVPAVVGRPEGAASATLRRAGFLVTVVVEPECDPGAEGCDYRPGVVWAQDPRGGSRAPRGSRVTIRVNP
ncbi:MAG TPA: transglycosylase domain-containing protein [Actinomycetota bacterium]|nr:transglycosylase domain-containing protein [Actinomycetota bacterium]